MCGADAQRDVIFMTCDVDRDKVRKGEVQKEKRT